MNPPLRPTVPLNFELYSGIGNRFLLTEDLDLLPRAGDLAPLLCAPGQVVEDPVDGLLFVEECPGANPRMVVINGDGTRPGACGNGLRCVGWHLARKHRKTEFCVETDSGRRRVRLVHQKGSRAALTSDMGQVRVAVLEGPPIPVPGCVEIRGAWLGNPHAVVLVEDERPLDVVTISQTFAEHPDFPEGVNVGFLAGRDGVWHLRVHERGVGETMACGTGATAAAATLANLGRVPALGPVTVRMAGGDLRVDLRPEGRADLLGEAAALGAFEVHPSTSREAPWVTSSRS